MSVSNAEKLERRSTKRPIAPWQNDSHWRSWVASTSFHCLVFGLLAWFWRPYSHGTQGDRDRPIGIAIVHHNQGSTEYFLEAGGQNSAQTDKPSASSLAKSMSAISSNDPNGAMNVDELLGEFAGIAKSTLGGEGSGDGKSSTGLSGLGDSGSGTGKLKTKETKTTVFGIEGSGNSFVYVFDRSESMKGYEGAPLRLAKRELAQSLESLTSVNQFQVIFYNEAPNPYQGSLSGTKGLIFATDTEKVSAAAFVKGIVGSGGTQHIPAVQMGINLGSDVIFFLTDAADPSLTPSQVNEIAERCISRRTTIHSIEFGTGPSPGRDRWIEQLAQRTGGKYRYLDVTSFEQ